MPNWCSNYLILEGKVKELKRFLSKAKGVDGNGDPILLSFESLMPLKGKNGLLFAWGCKWDLIECFSNDTERINKANDDNVETLTFNFETAWSPPIGVMEQIVKDFDLELRLEYCEHGCDFSGYAESCNKDFIDVCGRAYEFCKCEPYEEDE